MGTTTQDVFYSLRQRKDGRRELSISVLKDAHAEFVCLETDKAIKHITLSRGGQIIIISDGRHILVGNKRVVDVASPESFHYTWRELSLPVNATCFDIRESQPEDESKTKGSKKASPVVDLVLGESSGSILIYHDIVNSLSRKESAHEGESRTPVFRRLHWHRGAVTAVRWSRDGMLPSN